MIAVELIERLCGFIFHVIILNAIRLDVAVSNTDVLDLACCLLA